MVGNNPDVWCHRNKTTRWQLNCSLFSGMFWHPKDPAPSTFSSSELWAVISTVNYFSVLLQDVCRARAFFEQVGKTQRSGSCTPFLERTHFCPSCWDNVNLNSYWVCFCLSPLSLTDTHTHTHIHTQRSSHLVSTCPYWADEVIINWFQGFWDPLQRGSLKEFRDMPRRTVICYYGLDKPSLLHSYILKDPKADQMVSLVLQEIPMAVGERTAPQPLPSSRPLSRPTLLQDNVHPYPPG